MKPAKLPHPCYGWKPVGLYQNLTMVQLVELQQAIRDDPASACPKYKNGGLWLFTPAARRKLDAIAWAITHHLSDKKAAV